jgi:putative N6-adenine-specific DNA methylase
MVEFNATTEKMYELNYRLFTALRILESFHSFTFHDIHEYYDRIREIPWKTLITADQTIAIDAGVFKCNAFNNSHFTEMKTKDAVADYFRDETGKRPSVSLDNPDLLINIYITGDYCHVSLDTSGTPLYKRGYRQELHEASINEVLAAGMIRLSGWNGEGDFYDPMCGGATIPIEAAMFASGIPAGHYRKEWGFMKWKTFDPQLWETIKKNFSQKIPSEKAFTMHASDISPRSLSVARKNIASARMMKIISLQQCAFDRLIPKGESGTMIFNPPYNIRLGVDDIVEFYKNLGNHMKHNFKGHNVWIISSDHNAIKHVGLKPSKKYMLMNGQHEARFHGFELY